MRGRLEGYTAPLRLNGAISFPVLREREKTGFSNTRTYKWRSTQGAIAIFLQHRDFNRQIG